MGIPGDSGWDGVIVDFQGITKIISTLPSPPNGQWYLPRLDDQTFYRQFDAWYIEFFIVQSGPHLGEWCLQAWSTIAEMGWAFFAEHGVTPPLDLLRFDNELLPWQYGYVSGIGLVVPVRHTSFTPSLDDTIQALNLTGGSRVFAEQFPAHGNARGLRLARVSDHTCVKVVLNPVS